MTAPRKLIIEDMEFTYRPLTRGQVKALKNDGIDFTDLRRGDMDANVDKILTEAGVDMDRADDLPYFEAMRLVTAILDATFLGPKEKKSESPPGSSKRENSGTAQSADGND